MPTARVASPTSGALRGVRAAVVATATVLLAVAAHELGGGMAAPAPVVGGLVVLVAAIAYGLSGRRWSTAQLVAIMSLAQAALHLSCAWTHDPAMAHAPRETSDGPAMLLWHVAATAVTVALVRHGERALWSLVAALGLRPFRSLRAVSTSPGPVRRVAPSAPPCVPHPRPLAVATPRRGPPVALAR